MYQLSVQNVSLKSSLLNEDSMSPNSNITNEQGNASEEMICSEVTGKHSRNHFAQQ